MSDNYNMTEYIEKNKLYERCVELEEQAVNYLNTLHSAPIEERVWLAILAERSAFKQDVFDAPTADVVEVIRCKYCKWWKLSEYNTVGIHICQRFSGVRGENDFCSRGERREDD